MGGRSAKDNFTRRFGDPARIGIEYAKDKIAISEEVYRSEQLSKAYAGVLKGILAREPTHDEVIGNTEVVVSKKLQRD
jgi:hypothetical protein